MLLHDISWSVPLRYIYIFIGSYIIYRLSLVVYRLTLHPLAKIPGYKLAIASRLYEFHYDSTMHGRYWVKLQEMHDKLGPIIRINPYEVHINDPEFYHKLYNFDPSWNKNPRSVGALNNKDNIESTVESALHKKRRAPFEGFFSRKQITVVESMIHKYVDKLCEAIREGGEKQQAIRFDVVARAFTAEIICGYCFGKQYGFFEDLTGAEDLLVEFARPGDLKYVHHIGRFSLLLQRLLETTQTIEYMIRMKLGLKMNRGATLFFKYAKSLVAGVLKGEKGHDKEDTGTSTRSIFHEILDSELPPSEKTDKILFQNAALFLFAGFETTGFSLTLGVASILSDEAIHNRLKDEIRSIWPDVGDSSSMPSWAELEKLPFLHACILESLRLSCGVLSRLPRITDHPVIYKDYVIPAGYPISMSQPLIHYNSAIFPDPMAFNPDRWLEGTPEDRKKLERYLVPFSGGSRACIGKHLAMAELHIALASVIRRFEDMRVVPPTTKEDMMPYHDEFTPTPKSGKQKLMVEVH